MKINPFKLEEYLTKYEFAAKYLLCCSDAESVKMSELLDIASTPCQNLWNNLSLGYTEPRGHPLLLEEIAKLYPGLFYKNILCFSGAEEGIFATLSTICTEHDHVIVLTPCYQSLCEIPKMKSSSVTEIMLKEENQWKIDLQEIKNNIRPNTKCIVINFPHNPTGQVIERRELEELVRICRENDIWLFSDEVFRLLGNPHNSWPFPAASMYEKAISLGVMSKAFGLSGLRVGWIACQDEEMLQEIKLISLDQIKLILDIKNNLDELFESQKMAFIDFCSDLYDVPFPMQFVFKEQKSDFHIKAARRQGSEYLVLKVAGSGPFSNSGISATGEIFVFSATDGQLKLIDKIIVLFYA